ncbi:MAG: ScyD/ScyE family protein [Chloroflexota bacterium]|nr:ScyD/ScyE family protein [Chloroflexota bacterium]MDP9470163.1 ScyD/ScyE family protein [Chloroflexota bacterium]
MTHLWDQGSAAGGWFADSDHLGLRYPGLVMYDAFLLFGREARWDDAPSNLLASGWTVIGTTDELEGALDALPAAGVPAPRSATPESGGAITVVGAGLTNPRGFSFQPDGTLSVALAGRPGPNAGVVRIEGGCPTLVAGGLPAYRIVFGGVTGVADIAFLDGQLYALLSGGDINRRGRPNGLYRLDSAGGTELVADISAFIRDNPVAEKPRDYDTDGQPYAMLAMGDAFWVTEGNSNQVLRVGLDGSVARVADLSRGHPIPTGIAPAPDGGAYVAFFTHAPYAEGTAKVVAVSRDGAVTDVWTGLTLVTALAVGPDGTLYALEMATGHGDDADAIAPGTGRVVRMVGPDAAEPVVTGLTLPSAMDFGPDGALYVGSPTFGADDGQGIILRIDLSTERPIAVPPDLPVGPACP